jgi:hypothetical protein
MAASVQARRELTRDVFVVDGFVSAAACREVLAELDHALWKPSLTYQPSADEMHKQVLTQNRVSETAHQDFFPSQLVELLNPIEEHLTEEFGIDRGHLEWWQATRYPAGGHLGYHLDAGYWDEHYAGDRLLTFLLFLTTPVAGGGTHFRALDLLVEARAGRLLAWKNLFADGGANHSMIHAGTPVCKGEKVTLVTWQRQRPFRP